MSEKLAPELSWSDNEKDQMWVMRYTEVPKVGSDGKTRMSRMDTPLWRHCVARHKARWFGTKRAKGPPRDYFSADYKGIGWWFPKIWTVDFKLGSLTAIAPPKHPSTPMPEAEWKFPFPGLKVFQSWGLPVGTIIDAEHATVIYPNGAVETWAAIERRQGGLAGGLPASRDEDEPPPPSYL